MSLNNIRLKTTMLVDLYKNSLVETGAAPTPQPRRFKFLGNNQKQILVVVSHKNLPFLPDEEFSFLSNILAACKLSIADIAIINNENIEQDDLQYLIQSEAKSVLLFGLEPLSIGLPIHFPAFQLQGFENRTYLHAPVLSQIENDKSLKSQLWSALKALLGI